MTSARTQLCLLFTSSQLPNLSCTNKSELCRMQGTALPLVMVSQFLRNLTPPNPPRTFLLPTFSNASAHEVPDRQLLEAPRWGSLKERGGGALLPVPTGARLGPSAAAPSGSSRRGPAASPPGTPPGRSLAWRRPSPSRPPPGPAPAATERPPHSQARPRTPLWDEWAAPPPLTSVRSPHRARRLGPGRRESAGSHSKPVRPGPRVCFPVQRARGGTSGAGVGFGGGGSRKPWQSSLLGNGARRRRERAERSCARAAAAVKPPFVWREARRRDVSGTWGPESVRGVRGPSGAPAPLVLAVILSTYKSAAVTKLPGALGAVTFRRTLSVKWHWVLRWSLCSEVLYLKLVSSSEPGCVQLAPMCR